MKAQGYLRQCKGSGGEVGCWLMKMKLVRVSPALM